MIKLDPFFGNQCETKSIFELKTFFIPISEKTYFSQLLTFFRVQSGSQGFQMKTFVIGVTA